MFGVEFLAHFFPERTVFTSVTAAEDGDFASLLAQGAGEDFDHRSLACTAAGQISYADHQASEGVMAYDPAVIEPEAELCTIAEKTGNKKEQRQQSAVKPFLASAGHHFKEILFQILSFQLKFMHVLFSGFVIYILYHKFAFFASPEIQKFASVNHQN